MKLGFFVVLFYESYLSIREVRFGLAIKSARCGFLKAALTLRCWVSVYGQVGGRSGTRGGPEEVCFGKYAKVLVVT